MRDAKTNPPLREVYKALFDRWGKQHWWPGDSRFETIIGAILTQNTSWTNVERAISSLKKCGELTPQRIHRCTVEELAGLIRSSGTFRVKAQRIKNFTDWLYRVYGGSLDAMLEQETPALRSELLGINGIGEETADCILLYAGNRDVFVVDAYARRILKRHGWTPSRDDYETVADLFHRTWAHTPARDRAQMFNEYHALIVKLAKEFCRARPNCQNCPLNRWTPVHDGFV